MPDLIIVGGSVRAAASSALRAGFSPWCVDLFGDSDLQALVPESVVCPTGHYPHGLVEIFRDAPEVPWIYTGGLENHANLVRELAELRPLWGNGPNTLQVSRSPFRLQAMLEAAGFCTPEVKRFDAEISGANWLRKPLRGAGGSAIAFHSSTAKTPDDMYLQAFVDGVSMSAIYARARGSVTLLGVTEQLIGCDCLHASAFAYAGSIGPVPLSPALRSELIRLGQCVGEGCGLLGLFGIDFILHNERPWVIEVNPRYTASIEIIERATGLHALSHHQRAFDATCCETTHAGSDSSWQAKAILYAEQRFTVPDKLAEIFAREISEARAGRFPNLADLPRVGDVIEKDWPILTCFAQGGTREACWDNLQSQLRAVRSRSYV